jgi:hypothetical protein
MILNHHLPFPYSQHSTIFYPLHPSSAVLAFLFSYYIVAMWTRSFLLISLSSFLITWLVHLSLVNLLYLLISNYMISDYAVFFRCHFYISHYTLFPVFSFQSTVGMSVHYFYWWRMFHVHMSILVLWGSF